MAEPKDKHERARELSEHALGEYAEGHAEAGDRLAEQALKTDRSAVEEVVADLEEDARTTGVPDKGD